MYTIGQGKCAKKDGDKGTGYYIPTVDAADDNACMQFCEADEECKFFHFYQVGYTAPRGACIIWNQDGLIANGESTADCYTRKPRFNYKGSKGTPKMILSQSICNKRAFIKNHLSVVQCKE